MVLFTTARCDTRYRDIWLTSRLWVEILNSMGLNGSVTVKSFNSAMSDSKYGFPYSDDLKSTNPTGIFRFAYRQDHYYYITDQGKLPEEPPKIFKDRQVWVKNIEERSAELLVEVGPTPAPSNSPIIQPQPGTIAQKTTKKRKSEVAQLEDVVIHQNTVEPRYIPSTDKKNVRKQRGALRKYETIRKKATRPIEKKLSMVQKKNLALEEEVTKLKMIAKNLDASDASMRSIIDRIDEENMTDDIITNVDGLVRQLGAILGKHLSGEKKAVRIIQQCMKTYTLEEIPLFLVQPMIRSTFSAWKVGESCSFIFYSC